MGAREPLVDVMARIREATRAVRPVDPEFAAALARRWAGLPETARTAGQTLGRHAVGYEGTHGVFPKCNLACTPRNGSANARPVTISGCTTASAPACRAAACSPRPATLAARPALH